MKTVLIIDDDVDFGAQIAEFLEFENYQVSVINDPSQVTSHIQKEKYDIILIDLKMPNISGIDLVRDIKKFQSQSALFIISGRPALEKLVDDEGVREYINGFLNKPFSPEQLLKTIQSA